MASPIIREIEVRSVLTKSNLPVSDYSVNPYVGCTHACRYCYASFMKRFTGHPEPWGTFLDVKYWPEIRRPERYAGKELFIGSVTDPYLPQEEVFGRTRALLEQLSGSGVRISIATKSDLVLRDLAGKSEPAGQLQSGHHGLYSGKASAASAAVSGNLSKGKPLLLGASGYGTEKLCR